MGARTLGDLEPWARALLADARVGHLGLLDDDGLPRVLPVTFVVADAWVWSAVDAKPKKRPDRPLARERWLRARPASALAVDRYDEDWTRLAWVQVLGRTAIEPATAHPAILAALAEKYPAYRERAPAGPLLALAPRRVLAWRAAGA